MSSAEKLLPESGTTPFLSTDHGIPGLQSQRARLVEQKLPKLPNRPSQCKNGDGLLRINGWFSELPDLAIGGLSDFDHAFGGKLFGFHVAGGNVIRAHFEQ